MPSWKYIMHHHSTTVDGETFSASAIRRYHMDTLGWLDVGYHFLIERVGDEYEVIVGRPLNMTGAHCKQHGMNNEAIGICWVGNFDDEKPDPKMIEVGARRIIRPLMWLFQIGVREQLFHRTFAPYKTCPGRRFDLIELISHLADGA